MTCSLEKSNTDLEGSIEKYTNCFKGYEKRWFILSGGTLRYYKSQSEVGIGCRGEIYLPGTFVYREGFSNIIVDGMMQTFRLKISDEESNRKWLEALESARAKAMLRDKAISNCKVHGILDRGFNFHSFIAAFKRNIEDQRTCLMLTSRHKLCLEKTLAESKQWQKEGQENTDDFRRIFELAEYFQLTASKMIELSEQSLWAAKKEAEKYERLIKCERRSAALLRQRIARLKLQCSPKENEANQFLRLTQPTLSKDTTSDDAIQFDRTNESRRTSVASPSSMQHATVVDVSFTGKGITDSPEDNQASKASISGSCSIDSLSFPPTPTVSQETSSEEKPVPKASVPVVKARKRKSQRPVSRTRRTTIPPKPSTGLSLWSILKKCIGKDVTRIPMPVEFNEPLSMLQRLTEDLEYSYLLDKAALIQDSSEQMAFVAAFTVSSYSTTVNRTGKPFNPLLGETYEADRLADLGWRSLTEQVSHHPPVASQFAEGAAGWRLWQEFTMLTKFRGKYISLTPQGIAHLQFQKSNNHYTWTKVSTSVSNIIIGTLRIDNYGEMRIENHTTGDKCLLKYIPQSFFSREQARKVTGYVSDVKGNVKWTVDGSWADHIDIAKADQNTLPLTRIWKAYSPIPNSDKMYNFSKLAIELNEEEEGVAPTDSRNRPDQRLLEKGDMESANQEKERLEEKQRNAKRQQDMEDEKIMRRGSHVKGYEPMWFAKQTDVQTGDPIHVFTGKYWKAKEKKNWSKCPDIF